MSLNSDCIFCKIIEGTIPSFKIYEDNYVFAFLDINPLSKGHTLVIPKFHGEKLHDIPSDILQHILPTIKIVAEAMELSNYNLLQNNGKLAHQEVQHVHFHLIPKFSEGDGLSFKFHPLPIEPSELDEFSQKIRAKLSKS